jgi:hypothetical protein
VLLQQAIFTSTRGGLNAGYHLASRCPEISEQLAHQLVQWGPSHDSLVESSSTGSLNFHPLSDGGYCVSRSVLAGREYSGRRGQRVYTQMFVLPPEGLARFANSPFRVMEALTAGGRTETLDPLPSELEPVRLIGRASPIHLPNLEYVARRIEPDRLAALVSAALQTERLGIVSSLCPRKLFACLIDLIPLSERPHFSLTTGLRPSLQRPFRLSSLPPDSANQRRLRRRGSPAVFDLRQAAPSEYRIDHGWPMLVHQLLAAEEYQRLNSAVQELAENPGRNPDQLAESLVTQLG